MEIHQMKPVSRSQAGSNGPKVRSAGRNIASNYHTPMEGRKLPLPVVFWSDSEKDAYKKNRVIQTKLNSVLHEIRVQRKASARLIHCEALRFRLKTTRGSQRIPPLCVGNWTTFPVRKESKSKKELKEDDTTFHALKVETPRDTNKNNGLTCIIAPAREGENSVRICPFSARRGNRHVNSSQASSQDLEKGIPSQTLQSRSVNTDDNNGDDNDRITDAEAESICEEITQFVPIDSDRCVKIVRRPFKSENVPFLDVSKSADCERNTTPFGKLREAKIKKKVHWGTPETIRSETAFSFSSRVGSNTARTYSAPRSVVVELRSALKFEKEKYAVNQAKVADYLQELRMCGFSVRNYHNPSVRKQFPVGC